MILIIDTNIIYGNWMLRNQESQAFIDFARKTESTILVPRIAWLEIRKNYKDEFLAKQKSYVEAAKHFSSVLIDKPDFLKIEPEIESQVESYLNWLNNFLKISNRDVVIPYSDDTLDKVAQRALEHRRPFNPENQREFKYSLVWQAVLDILERGKYQNHEEVVLISNDKNAFAADKNSFELHLDLRNEIENLMQLSFASSFYYYTDLKSFLAKHNTPIANITLDSVTEYLESEAVNFLSIFSKEISNIIDYFIEYFYETFPNVTFPSLSTYITAATYKGLRQGGEIFLYKYQTGAKITIFCTKYAIFSTYIQYSSINSPEIIEMANRELEFYFNATITYDNNTYGEISIDNIAMSEPEEFKSNHNRFKLSPIAIKSIEDLVFESSVDKDADREELLRMVAMLHSSQRQSDSVARFLLDLESKSALINKRTGKIKGPKIKRKRRK